MVGKELSPFGLLFLITGPTGSGKDTVLNHLELPHRRIVTHTSRARGLHEVDGYDYHFISALEFEQMIDWGLLLEFYQNGRGDFYGTSQAEVDAKRGLSLTAWRLNPDGAFGLLDNPSLRDSLQPLLVVCLVADLDVLATRIRIRGRERGLDVLERGIQAFDDLSLIARRAQAVREEEEILRRLGGAIGDERLMFHNGHSWTDDQACAANSRTALMMVENRQGMDNPDGFPRTLRIVTETINHLTDLWQLGKNFPILDR